MLTIGTLVLGRSLRGTTKEQLWERGRKQTCQPRYVKCARETAEAWLQPGAPCLQDLLRTNNSAAVFWDNNHRYKLVGGGLKVKSLKSISSTFKCMCVQREPCRVAHGKNEGEAGWRDIEESQRVMNNFSTTSAMLDCRKLCKWYRLKCLRISFFLLSSLFSYNFQPVLGANRCSYRKLAGKMAGCDSEECSSARIPSDRQHLPEGQSRLKYNWGTFWENPRPAQSWQIADGKLLCYSSHTGPQKAVNSQPYIKMINFTQMSTT